MAGDCGTCTCCCRVFTVPEVKPNPHDWCQHCEIGKGCRIYQVRPLACVDFKCMWLESQSQERPFPLELRPDKNKVVMSPTTNPNIIAGITMPGYPGAWRKQMTRRLVDILVRKGFHFVVGPPGAMKRTMVTRHEETGEIIEKEVEMTPPDKDGMQWNVD